MRQNRDRVTDAGAHGRVFRLVTTICVRRPRFHACSDQVPPILRICASLEFWRILFLPTDDAGAMLQVVHNPNEHTPGHRPLRIRGPRPGSGHCVAAPPKRCTL